MAPFRHLLEILWRRECGFYDPYPQRSCDAMLRSLYKDKGNNFFDCIYQETSSKHIYMIENRLYFDNLSICKTFFGHEKPQLQYSQQTSDLQQQRLAKIADFTAINAVGLDRTPVPRAEYRNVIYILNEKSTLIEQDMITGKKLREVYLFDYRLCKFRNISFHDELNRMYIESIRHPWKSLDPEVIFSVVIFQVLPLQLLGFVEFRKTLFGAGHHPGGALKEIDFLNDILITYHGPNREKSRTYVYDFNQILCPSNKLFDAQLDRYCGAFGLVGHRPKGIPVNYQIKHLPPPLYAIDQTEESIQFSPLPMWHIFGREKGAFEVYDTASKKLIGRLGSAMSPVERFYNMEEYFVAMDFHDRVLYRNAEKIQVYSVKRHHCLEQPTDHQCQSLVLDFELKLPDERNGDTDIEVDSQQVAKGGDKVSLPKRVMPARLTKTNRIISLCENPTRICAFSYYEPLEVFILLADIPRYAGTGSVLLYDAFDGQLMVQFHTPIIVTNNAYYDVHIYYDYIYVLEKAVNAQKFRIFAFQLFRDAEPIDVDG